MTPTPAPWASSSTSTSFDPASFVRAAAVLTPSPDPWTQIVFAAPMLVMYAISIGIAWIAAPRRATSERAPHLRLVVAATVLDQARRYSRR
jgi:Sec-independent protein secretion pathway component TatC